MIRLTKRSRLTLAVAETIVAHYLDCDGPVISMHADLGADDINCLVNVHLRTHDDYRLPESTSFYVRVYHRENGEQNTAVLELPKENCKIEYSWSFDSPYVSVSVLRDGPCDSFEETRC